MIKSEEGNSQCLTETLAAWLQGRDGAAAPTWRAVVKALLSPTINFQRLAQQISTEHQCNDSESSSVTGSEDSALEDVDNTTLGKPLSGYFQCHKYGQNCLLFRGAQCKMFFTVLLFL